MFLELPNLQESVVALAESYLAPAANVASLVTLALGFIGGMWWRRHRQLIDEDRDTTLSLVKLHEVYLYLERAEQVLDHSLIDRMPPKAKVLDAHKGLVESRQRISTFFGFVYGAELFGPNPLIFMAKFYERKGHFEAAEECYRRALHHFQNGKALTSEMLAKCLEGYQSCAIVLGRRDVAYECARLAETRSLECCLSEDDLKKWFFFRRLFKVLQARTPDLLKLMLRGKRGSRTSLKR